MKTYILSNINMDSLKYYMKKDIIFKGSCAYGNHIIDLIDESSFLYTNDVDLVVLILDGDELKKQGNIEEIFEAVHIFLKKRNVTFMISTISLFPSYIDTYLNESSYFEFDTNKKIIEFQRNNNILLLDIHKIVLKFGANKVYDEKFWYMGRIKYSKIMFEAIVYEIDNIMDAYKGNVKKVLILDLDNTLWGGVIGEDGLSVKLSNEGEGKIYQDFQLNIKKMKDYGVLLAVNSKNNYDDAMEGLNNPNSQLSKDDFVIIKANWNDKVSNIKEIAQKLNLGLDSFVFIDDNAVERSLVKEYIPELEVPDFPKDMNYYNQWFIKDVVYKFFPKFKLTKEDIKKTDQYKANAQRKGLESTSVDLDAFLKSLDIKINFYTDKDEYIERYAQMTQKTNQFNLTTKRYTISDIKKFISSDKFIVYAIDYEDKFLKEGIIGLVIIELNDEEAIIDTFLLSCRVLKRGVEKALFEKMVADLSNKGIKKIIGLYYPTKKNILVKNLYENYGFNKISENEYIKEI